MKKFYTLLLFLVSIAMFWGCSGEDGLPGPQGPEGPEGEPGPLALMYEIEFDLGSANDWQAMYWFPQADEIYEEDVVLVYLLWAYDDGAPVWRLMPIFLFGDAGTPIINYDFTTDNVRIFLDSQYDLDPALHYYPDEIARIVVVPAYRSRNGRQAVVDYSDYEAVKAAYGLKEPTTPLKGTPLKETLERIKS